MRLVVSRYDHRARGFAVQSMDNARSKGTARRGEISEPVQQRVHQRPLRMPGTCVNHHPRRLVHNHEIVIYEEQFKREILRLGHRRGPRQYINLDGFARLDPVGDFGEAAVDMNASFADQFLDPRAAQLRHPFGEKQVEPPPSIRRRRGKFLVFSSTGFSLWILPLIFHLGRIWRTRLKSGPWARNSTR